jgi:hypothetical protein
MVEPRSRSDVRFHGAVGIDLVLVEFGWRSLSHTVALAEKNGGTPVDHFPKNGVIYPARLTRM